MDQAVAALVARQEITDVLHRVARGTDRGDVALFASCFHEDGTDYHGLANGPVRNILAVLGRSRLTFTQHAISNIIIDLDGDIARAESCFNAAHQGPDEDGRLWDEEIRGRYLDRLERRGGGPWKIARRVVLWDWSRLLPAGDENWFDRVRRRPGADHRFIFGRRDRQDMVYTDTLPPGFEEA